MSDTPRTDARRAEWASSMPHDYVSTGFACQLERELIQALKDKYDAEFALSTTRQQLLAAQVEVKRLRDAIADYVEANNASWLEISNAAIAAGTSTVVLTDKQAAALNKYNALSQALATPPDLSALSLHDQELLKDAKAEIARQKNAIIAAWVAEAKARKEGAREALEKAADWFESAPDHKLHTSFGVRDQLRRMLAELDQAPVNSDVG